CFKHIFSQLLSLYSLQCGSCNGITSKVAEVFAKEESEIIMSCDISTTLRNLFWYRQHHRSAPQILVTMYKPGKEEESTEGPRIDFNQRLHSELSTMLKTVPLKIQDLQVSDSAVYYCALQPTVTHAQSTLIQKHISILLSIENPHSFMLANLICKIFGSVLLNFAVNFNEIRKPIKLRSQSLQEVPKTHSVCLSLLPEGA
uniref:Ig-like domain-containing protein n=1 Tax=Denticeps clupeoides TaxID=299321 RepID=A0AAY4AHH7_9TELE